MKTFFLTFVSIFLLYNTAYSQAVLDGVYVKSDEELIDNTDKLKRAIKANLGSYKKTEKSKDKTESRYIYRRDKELRLITIHSENKAQHLDYAKEYYFYNKHLILAEVTTTENTSNNILDNEKMYLDNDHLLIWFVNENKVDPASDKFKKAAKEVNDFAAQLKIEYMY